MTYHGSLSAAASACLGGSLLLLVAACGDDGGSGPDLADAAAGEPDAAEPDAGEPDAGPAYDVTVAGTITDTEMRGGNGGALTEDACADGQALIGFSGNLSGSIDGIRGVCADLGVEGEAVVTGEPVELPLRGRAASAQDWERLCPADHVVTGFRGRAGILIDELTFRCAPASVVDDGSGPALVIGEPVDTDPVGGPNSAEFAQTDCPAGQIGAEARVRSGSSIDALGLGCRVPALVAGD